ncbi:uncharacterized protein DDB_G0290685-like [Apis laboriosa]|uniref:uncharacterized protein DDB_G0290685-like n=1 Tax=Apis laboriosa TaxID=183418 RepID=UPI001CC4E69A|nr:uncharacterized protein DDB_G0290685-like [Apis laboriosa]
MIVRLHLNCAYILVLSILLRSFVSHCFPEVVKDTASNADAGGYAIEDQGNKVDPSIERIFRGSGVERRNYATNSKRNIEAVSDKTTIRTEDTRKRPRIKRGEEVVVKRGASNEGAKIEEKRSASSKGAGKGAGSRIGRSSSSRDLPKLPVKDYEVPLEQERSSVYGDEAEEEVAGFGARNKEARYRGGGEYGAGEDSARFIDQEERSSLYDDFEAKDVVKRGISGAEDYEEMEEEGVEGGMDDGAAFDESSIDEEVGGEKRKYRGGDVRVKREHEASSSGNGGGGGGGGSSSSSNNNNNNSNNKEAIEGADISGTKMNGESGEAERAAEASSSSAVEQKPMDASLKRDASDKGEANNKGESNQLGQAKEGKESSQQSKRNVLDKNENDGSSKSGCDRDTDNAKNEKPLLSSMNDQKVEMESDEGAKLLQNQESQEAVGGEAAGGKTQEINLSNNENKPIGNLIGDSLGVKGVDASKTEESKIADIGNPETLKGGDIPANVPETAAVENANEKSESSQKGSESGSAEQVDEDYQKRVEEQIQRKIDSIKEEIKREITENQRIREIEENNAKFEELRDEEEEEEDEEEDDQENEATIDKRDTVSKRSPENSGDKSQIREEKRFAMVRRKKRQGENGGGNGNNNNNNSNQDKQDANESSSSKKTRQAATMKKRSAAKLEAQDPEKIPRKRERPREVILVERPDRKKKRRRRAKNTEQRGAKLEGNQPADFVQDSSLRGNLGDGKVKGGN